MSDVYFRSLRHTRTKMTTATIPKTSSPTITANTITSSLLPESISRCAPLSDSLLMIAEVNQQRDLQGLARHLSLVARHGFYVSGW
jgi:hypothetical protein